MRRWVRGGLIWVRECVDNRVNCVSIGCVDRAC